MKNRILIIFCLFIALLTKAQDKIFFKDGTLIHGKIMSISESTISFKDTLNMEQIKTVPKKDVLLAEYQNGSIFIFGGDPNANNSQPAYETWQQRKARKLKEWKEKEANMPDGILGFYIPELILGRLTVSYERFFANKTLGVKVPVSLTYNPFGLMTNNYDTTSVNYNYKRGVGFVTGVDINYYTDLKPELKYYFGPRFRYGTDILMGTLAGYTTTGYSLQLQNGIMRSRGDRFTSTIGVGFGFYKSTISSTLSGYDPQRFYPWMSITWRLGFRL